MNFVELWTMFERGRKKEKILGDYRYSRVINFGRGSKEGWFRWRLKFRGVQFLWILSSCEQCSKEEEKGKNYSHLINFGRGSKEGWFRWRLKFRGVQFLWILSSCEQCSKEEEKGKSLGRLSLILSNKFWKYEIIARRKKSICYLLLVPLCS